MEEAKAAGAKKGDSGESEKSAVASMAVDALAKEAKYEKLAEAEELDREVLGELERRK